MFYTSKDSIALQIKIDSKMGISKHLSGEVMDLSTKKMAKLKNGNFFSP